MQLTFLGCADEVGASSTLVRIGGQTILVDAGIRISPRTSRGIHVDRCALSASLAEEPDPDVAGKVGAEIEERTGYRLEVSG